MVAAESPVAENDFAPVELTATDVEWAAPVPVLRFAELGGVALLEQKAYSVPFASLVVTPPVPVVWPVLAPVADDSVGAVVSPRWMCR